MDPRKVVHNGLANGEGLQGRVGIGGGVRVRVAVAVRVRVRVKVEW